MTRRSRLVCVDRPACGDVDCARCYPAYETVSTSMDIIVSNTGQWDHLLAQLEGTTMNDPTDPPKPAHAAAHPEPAPPRTFVRHSSNPESVLYEVCALCSKHIRNHFGQPEKATPELPAYRCDPSPRAWAGTSVPPASSAPSSLSVPSSLAEAFALRSEEHSSALPGPVARRLGCTCISLGTRTPPGGSCEMAHADRCPLRGWRDRLPPSAPSDENETEHVKGQDHMSDETEMNDAADANDERAKGLADRTVVSLVVELRDLLSNTYLGTPGFSTASVESNLEHARHLCAALESKLVKLTLAERAERIASRVESSSFASTLIGAALGGLISGYMDGGKGRPAGAGVPGDEAPTSHIVPGKVPLSVSDPTAQDLLWAYAQRRRSVDAQFSADLERALRAKGFVEGDPEYLYILVDSRFGAQYASLDPAKVLALLGEVTIREGAQPTLVNPGNFCIKRVRSLDVPSSSATKKEG